MARLLSAEQKQEGAYTSQGRQRPYAKTTKPMPTLSHMIAANDSILEAVLAPAEK